MGAVWDFWLLHTARNSRFLQQLRRTYDVTLYHCWTVCTCDISWSRTSVQVLQVRFSGVSFFLCRFHRPKAHNQQKTNTKKFRMSSPTLLKPSGQMDSQLDASFRIVWTPNLRWLWSSSNSYVSRRKFFTVWPPNASRHKLIASPLYKHAWNLQLFATGWTCEPTCESVWPPIALVRIVLYFSVRRRLVSVWVGTKYANTKLTRATLDSMFVGKFTLLNRTFSGS